VKEPLPRHARSREPGSAPQPSSGLNLDRREKIPGAIPSSSGARGQAICGTFAVWSARRRGRAVITIVRRELSNPKETLLPVAFPAPCSRTQDSIGATPIHRAVAVINTRRVRYTGRGRS
jgi:hypothetical protein